MECHNIYTEETNNKIKLLRQISYQLRHIDITYSIFNQKE